jgi:hypothetical protein
MGDGLAVQNALDTAPSKGDAGEGVVVVGLGRF